MGFDMTFHPISRDLEGEIVSAFLQRKRTAAEIIAKLEGCTEDLVSVVDNILSVLLEDKDKRHPYLSIFISYRLAMISAYYKPCWYARGRQGISFMGENYPDVTKFITPAVDWLGGEFVDYGDPSKGFILENFCGSGVITDMKGFKKWFDGHRGEGVLDAEGLWSMKQCIDYCLAHNCHMIEATDVYSPMAGASINVEKSVRSYNGELIE